MTNVLCTCLLVTNVKSNTLVKLLTTFVVDGIITSLKVKILKEGKSAYKNIYINILKVKGILSSRWCFNNTYWWQTVLIPLRERITGCEPLKHLHLMALILLIVSSLGRWCRTTRDLSFVGHLQDLDFDKYLGHAISTRFDYSWFIHLIIFYLFIYIHRLLLYYYRVCFCHVLCIFRVLIV